ncbi:EpsG family protein [Bifidobacterium thermacidophilum]|uniref:EpsG family protein n=1 Tax=Bifidobacterium thermacidophilum subsp. thermacidophilum TaxID=79262 RepID=A0A087E3A1_9BIFI|nr:EpsG family protein [Bifidobacterium thermacidophilum]KFJ02252.1 hypothetical protein THER5_0428 [Bifidobacterium thermacidophilum subsp. thermacidophilum]
MVEYLLAVAVSVLFSVAYDLKRFGQKNSWTEKHKDFKLSNAVLVILAGFPYFYLQATRNELGADYQLYEQEFGNINSGYGYVHTDRGFQELNKIVFALGGNYVAMFAVVALIQTVGVYVLATTLQVPLTVFSLLYFLTFNYLQSYSLIAQYTAIGIICMAFALMIRGNYLFSILLLLISATIHSSSVVFIAYFIFYIFLTKAKNKTRLSLLYGCVVIIFGLVAQKIIPMILGGTRFSAYFERDDTELNSTSMIVINLFVAGLMMAVYYLEKEARDKIIYNFVLSIQFMALVSSLLQSAVPLMVRMAMYFSFFIVYTIPITMREITEKRIRYFGYGIIFLVFTVWLLAFPMVGNYYQVIPYK